MAKNSSMGSFTFWMSLQISEEVGPCRCCISAIVSVIVPFVLFVRQLWPLLQKDVRIYAHTFAPSYSESFTVMFICSTLFFFRPFKAKYYLLFSRFSLQHFMPFFIRLLDSCQYSNEVGAFYCRWCWALCKYRRTVIALTAVVLLTTAIGGSHANDALYLVFWLWRCNFSFIPFPSAACCLWLFHSCCFCLLFWPGL